MQKLTTTNYVSIKYNLFNPLYININQNANGNANKKETMIIYKSPSLFLNRICFNTPWMKVLDMTDTHIKLSFAGIENDAEIRDFYNCLAAFDKQMDYILKHKNASGKKYGCIIQVGENGEHHIKIYYGANINKNILLNNIECRDINIVYPNVANGHIAYARCLILCSGLYENNLEYSLQWTLYKLNINISNYTFMPSGNPNGIAADYDDPEEENIILPIV